MRDNRGSFRRHICLLNEPFYFWNAMIPKPCSTLQQLSVLLPPLLARGKVRDNYAVGDDRILMVASDRLSAFDVIMGEPIPGKGRC
jgi:phosphoribosylaminoimidazole-succinocarboxamide synthase